VKDQRPIRLSSFWELIEKAARREVLSLTFILKTILRTKNFFNHQ
jgi:hypothetical protein